MRANEYLISDFDFRESDLLIKVYKLDLITNTVNKFEFVVAKNETIVLEEDYVNTPVGNKTQYYLASRVFTDRIPVSVYDVDSSNLIEKICRYVKN